MILRAGLLALAVWPARLAAVELNLPANAQLMVERNTSPDRYLAPVAVFNNGEVPSLAINGDIARAAWRIDVAGLTPLQVIRPLQEQLRTAGFVVMLDCATKACGGFDFRFETEVLPAPNMYVNLNAFHFVTAFLGASDAPEKAVTLLTSTTNGSAYVQIVQAGGTSAKVATTRVGSVTSEAMPVGGLTARLLENGHVALGGLEFDTGSSDLGQGTYGSLETLAAFLDARPNVKMALVGHTDNVGSLDANIALSRRRAQSVRQRLIDVYGIAAARLDAQGMGYLAPVASNSNDAGREKNRRVEAILLEE